jgi:cytochrome c-type biogenesis protein CcmE
VVTDDTNRLTVIDTGGVPSLFRTGAGVVVEEDDGRGRPPSTRTRSW